ncbi:MAG TPA: YhjD/YihY/BrkB family envelope integrity protein, partial [Trebonia sp.]
SLTLNVGVFWLAFRLATMRMVPWRNLRFGAMLAALVWQVLQVAGGYVVTHSLQRVSTLYGAFGVVLGLLGWLYLQATVTVYCAEVDAVLAKGRWPRSLLSAAGAPPEGPVRPRHSVPAAVADEAVPDEAVPDEAVPDVATPGGTVPAVPVQARSREDTVPVSTVSTSTVPVSTVPTDTPKAGDDGRTATRRDDSRENGAASRDAGKDGARNSESGQGTSSA